ncbi:MAG: ACT domain-containing protein [bacterium]|nr:ACT domain-containing protein [bacterium]
MSQEVVISVLTPDRVGLIAGVTQAIYAAGGNICAISQTVLQGYFTIILIAAVPDECTPEQLQKAVEASGRAGELSVLVRPRRRGALPMGPMPSGDRFVLTMSGRDQPGLLARIAAYLASRGINIEDLAAHTDGGRFLLMGELTLPAREDVRQVYIDLEALVPTPDAVVTLQHINVFVATTEIGFRHRSVLSPRACSERKTY